MFSNFIVPIFYIYPPWYLMLYDWLVPSMRLQVIQDSLFSRLGSGPFSGRGKRESRNRTMIGSEKEQPIKILVVLTSHLVNMEKPLSIIKKA